MTSKGLDRFRINCIVLNVIRDHGEGLQKIRDHGEELQKINNNCAKNHDMLREQVLFQEKYGHVDDVRPYLKHTIDTWLYEEIPNSILTDKNLDIFYRFYRQTYFTLKNLPESEEINAYQLPIPFMKSEIEKPSSKDPLGRFPSLSCIHVFEKNDINSYRKYYRLLKIWENKILKMDNEAEEEIINITPQINEHPKNSTKEMFKKYAFRLIEYGCMAWVIYCVCLCVHEAFKSLNALFRRLYP